MTLPTQCSFAGSIQVLAYHGTTAGDFDAFTPRIRRGEQLGFGVHFSASADFAQRYADDPLVARRGKKPLIYTVELSLSRPLFSQQAASEGTDEFALAKRLCGSKVPAIRGLDGKPAIWLQNAIDACSPERAQRLILEAGYDGVVYESKIGTRHGPAGSIISGRSLSFVVLDPASVRILGKAVPGADTPLIQSARETIGQMIKQTVIRDQAGQPLIVYRGEHGDAGTLHSRLGSLSFGSFSAAEGYAREPNVHTDNAVSARIVAAFLDIRRPFIQANSCFLDLDIVERQLGPEEAMRIARKFSAQIEVTDGFSQVASDHNVDSVHQLLAASPASVADLYFDAYHYFDDRDEVERLQEAGFDGATHYGNGATALEPEYKVFSPAQVVILDGAPLGILPDHFRDLALARLSSSETDMKLAPAHSTVEPDEALDVEERTPVRRARP